jgi:UDP-N-acetylglucosamine pyrophosphorylase
MFVSNSDNLGATLDLDILNYFVSSGKPFLMEVCERTQADKKGGHLAIRTKDNRLILRESAQCDPQDETLFQDISRHQFFNTNNLWIRLDELKKMFKKNDGIIPLPMIKNSKTVDPQDSSSTQVFQLETAMGAAIECFDNAGAIVVPRTRFAPVKKCDDLFLLRSDAYVLTEDCTLRLNPALTVAPLVELDPKEYKLVEALDKCIPNGPPSMLECISLKVHGKIIFDKEVRLVGDVNVSNPDQTQWALVKSGTYDHSVADGTCISFLKSCSIM